MNLWDAPRARPRYLRLHRKEPDYSRPLLEIPRRDRDRIRGILQSIYGQDGPARCYAEIERLMRVYYAFKTPEMIEDDGDFHPADRFTEKDVILITYGDTIRSPGKKPLQALSDLLRVLPRRLVNTVHILPFFPYSSDRGFAIKSYYEVDPQLGTWEDIEQLGLEFKLMFDGVVNHVSSKSYWFQEFLNGNPEYRDFFITFSTRESVGEEHLKLILRPRTTPLLTEFDTLRGPRYVWTTFSPDHIDLNYRNEKVLLKVIEVMLHYVRRGADILRLDAVAYLWQELGTACAHLRKTHLVVQLLRAILDVAAPQVALITETNVPHEDNIRYFGDGADEAQMVYNFALPPLVLHAFLSGSCRRLSEWAASLDRVSETATYFNFLDSHDGVGLLPAQNILSEEEIRFLERKAIEHGGLVSYRSGEDGAKIPYELNIAWYDALNNPASAEDPVLRIERFVASRAIALAIVGVPGLYLPGLLGGRNDQEAVRQTGEARSINRAKVDETEVFERLGNTDSAFNRTARALGDLIEKRIECPAFHPNGAQRVLRGGDHVFALLRRSPDSSQSLIALTNVTGRRRRVELELPGECAGLSSWRSLLSGECIRAGSGRLAVQLAPYQVLWLRGES